MILRALRNDAEHVARFLTRIGEDPNPPPVAPARSPPYFRAPALRCILGELELETQMDRFGALPEAIVAVHSDRPALPFLAPCRSQATRTATFARSCVP